MMATIDEFKTLNGVELLEYIALKNEYPSEAESAFVVFRNKYERDILQRSEINCKSFGYSEVVALVAATCTFDKVWRSAGTFDMQKANTNNVDKAILAWMNQILYTQILLFNGGGTCAKPTEEEDLSIISNVDELIEHCSSGDIESKEELKSKLSIIEKALSGLPQAHKIIYLTYKAYKEKGKNIPRSVSKKLQDQLELKHTSIRVYKMIADNHVKEYLEKNNGNK